MRILKQALSVVIAVVICTSYSAMAAYNPDTNVCTVEYVPTMAEDIMVNIVCLKPDKTPENASFDDIELMNTVMLKSGESLSYSFIPKSNSPEGIYTVWVYTEQQIKPENPHESFYFLGNEGMSNLVKRFNGDEDYISLITEYTFEKPALHINIDDTNYVKNPSNITSLMKNEKGSDGKFNSVSEIQNAFSFACITDRINNLSFETLPEEATAVVEEMLSETKTELPDIAKDNMEMVINDFIQNKEMFSKIDDASTAFLNNSIFSLINSIKDTALMTEVITVYADMIGIDKDEYNNSNKEIVNKYVIGENFTEISKIAEAIGRGIDAADDTTSSNGGGKNSSSSSSNKGSSYGVSVPVIAEKGKITFYDLPESHWSSDAVEALKALGVLSGDGNGYFRPDDSVKREEFVKMLIEAFKIELSQTSTDFADSVNGSWYEPYVATAAKLGITNGKGNGTFGIGETITREDMAVFVHRASIVASKDYKSNFETAFIDNEEISGYAKEAVSILSSAGIINGMSDGRFAPKAYTTRAQAATMIYRAIN